MRLIDLSSRNDEVLLSLLLVSYQLTLVGTHVQPKMVWSPLTATSRVYRLLQAVTSRFAALQQKYNCLFAKYCCPALRLWNVAHKWTLSLKDLTTMPRTSWQRERTHGLNQRTYKAFYWKIYFQGLERTQKDLGTLYLLIPFWLENRDDC